MAQVRPNKPSSSALLQRTLKFSSYLFIYLFQIDISYILALQSNHYTHSPYHSMDSSHHHPHSTPALLAFFKACKSPGNSDVLGCKEAARHRQQFCDYCTSAKPPHCPHLQSGTCCTCHQKDFDLIEYSRYL
jgi:hypothetical protein